MSLNNFSRRIFALAAATRDRKVPLHFRERLGPAVDDLADLAIADGAAKADIHGWESHRRRRPRMVSILNTNANDCQLTAPFTLSFREPVDHLTVAAVTVFTRL